MALGRGLRLAGGKAARQGHVVSWRRLHPRGKVLVTDEVTAETARWGLLRLASRTRVRLVQEETVAVGQRAEFRPPGLASSRTDVAFRSSSPVGRHAAAGAGR